jgi:signal transduction histidine kinase
MEPAVQPHDSGLAAAAKPARSARRLDTERSTARAVLSGSQDSDVQELVNLLHNVCDVEIAAVTVPDGGQFHYLVTAGIEPLSCDSADTMCQHLMTNDEVVVVADTRADERFRTSPFVDGRMMALHFYASAPIHAPSGSIVGRLCLFDTGPKELTPVQRQTLSTLADSVSSVLDLRQRKRDTVNAAENAAAKGAHLEVMSVASQVSHDLRVPLTALSTSLDMLHESTPDEESPLRRKLLASARRSTARMAGLVDGLLRLNDVQRGLELSDVDLGDAVTQVLTDLETVLGDATVTVGPLPTVRGDADLLSAALLNLVSNAVKFARPGVAPVIEVTARRTAFGVRVLVRDNGIGIAPADRQRVFALFSRLTHTAGHGIGLTTVARVAEAHGGMVGIDDGPSGVGSEIWFELPA